MSRRADKVSASLLRKGFRRSEGKHSFFIYHAEDGRKSAVQTMISHSARDIEDPLLARMARQCRLSRPQFLDLVDCPLSREQFEALLKRSGALP